MRDFAETPIHVHDIAFHAADGRRLAGRLFEPERPLAAMAVFAATGYRKEFYEAFARAAARQGWAVLTFDYRGQGGSCNGPAREDEATMLDWGRRDMPAAARELKGRYPRLPLDIVGHSVGGHFLALLPDDVEVRRAALLSSSSGYWGKQSAKIKYTAWAFWRIVGPAFLVTRGHVPKGLMWKGEDLPPGVFRDWRDWGVRPDYFRDRLAEEGLLQRYARFRAPIKAWVADDDPIANREATRWLLEQYEAAPTEMKLVSRADLGRGAIGHHGLFHPAMADVFWPQVWRWLSREEGAREAA
ncbi:alpha/beta fold hydrolase [Marinicauda algicola]|uniref:Alpha/beta fold hydrolase n=1 Tax=Marinicauda algicola TaxID=2029849 RepID=A0A4S2H357_9PROT|nr:alpha/beta fold hydrolase [Marinicauda algicola]TGY89788.1 alpha/beta fold hydrolase [Marinicauda algicola]